jgi:hypothetical protein
MKYASRMQAQTYYFYSAFFTFIFLWFTRLCLFCPLFLFFMLTCVEFQARIMLHFAYSIFYIKPQTISVVKCNDIALNSCAVLLSFFVIDGMANAQLQALQYVQNKFCRESLVLGGHRKVLRLLSMLLYLLFKLIVIDFNEVILKYIKTYY